LTTGDNWNATKNTDAIAHAIGELKRRYHARQVVVAGHSGGATITVNLLGRHPAWIDAALLVSCHGRPLGKISSRWLDGL
jgi:pimeloyl-ACP methyl ester carboxylesterase